MFPDLAEGPQLFVGRQQLLKRIDLWASEAQPRLRLWSLLGPPGIGKSWLLQQVRDRLHAAGRLVFWADLTQTIDYQLSVPANVAVPPAMTSVAVPATFTVSARDRVAWLRAAIRQAKDSPCGAAIRDSHPNASLTVGLQTLLDDLCDGCQPSQPPIFIVDGYDDVRDTDLAKIDATFLSPMLERGCARMILARRDDMRLEDSVLRWNELPVPLDAFERGEGEEQLEKLQRLYSPSPTLDLRAVMDSIPPYPWTHPQANAWLYSRARSNYDLGISPVLSPADCRECIDAVADQPLPERVFQTLVRLAEIRHPLGGWRDEWTEMHARAMAIDLRDDTVASLFRLGLLVVVPPRYAVAAGLRDLVRAWSEARRSGMTKSPAE
jgi:hypothetical protein